MISLPEQVKRALISIYAVTPDELKEAGIVSLVLDVGRRQLVAEYDAKNETIYLVGLNKYIKV